MTDQQLLRRALEDLSDHGEFPEPVALVRRRIRRHQQRVRMAGAGGAALLLAGGALVATTLTGRADRPADNGNPRPTATAQQRIRTVPPLLHATVTSALGRVVLHRPWGSHGDAFGREPGVHEGEPMVPSALLADRSGHLFVVDPWNRLVHGFDARTGATLPDRTTSLPLGAIADTAAVDETTGDVYVAENNGPAATILDRIRPGEPLQRIHLTQSLLLGQLITANQGRVQTSTGTPLAVDGRPVGAGSPQRRTDLPPLVDVQGGRLLVRFASGTTVRVDVGVNLWLASEVQRVGPDLAWIEGATHDLKTRWVVRVTPTGATAFTIPSPVTPPGTMNQRYAATDSALYVFVGSDSGGRIVEYRPAGS